jgi:multimeric flavodoxin WrbA
MKITAINGSPKGKKSTTYLMVEEFLKGARDLKAETEHILLSNLKIHHCIGCLSCWTKTPGICVFHDDMQKINLSDSDIILFATPLYVDNISGLLKNFMDRNIYSGVPTITKDAKGEAVHPKRQKVRPKIMIMANCGFPGQSHFEVLKVLFRRVARNYQTDLIGEIYRDEGPLLTWPEAGLNEIVEKYKLLLRQAGKEIVQKLRISVTTQKALEEELIPQDLYLQHHNEFFKQFLTK